MPDDAPEPEPIRTRGAQMPPLVQGPERLHYQFSAALPQIHLTFVSVVQGIAVSILIQHIPLPNRHEAAHLWTFLLAKHLYLQWVISGMVVITIWKQFVQATMFILWPLSSRQIALMLLIAAMEVITFHEIQHFNAWLVGLGLIAIVGAVIRVNNIIIRRDNEYANTVSRKNDNLLVGLLYIAFGLLVGTLGAIFHYYPTATSALMSTVVLSQSSAQWIILGMVLCLAVAVFALDRRNLDLLIRNSAAGSDLTPTGHGGIAYNDKAKSKRISRFSFIRRRR